MSSGGRKRLSSEVLKRGYSDEEINQIYELARFSLENGDIRRAEAILVGLVEVAPAYVPGWLALSYVQVFNGNVEGATSAAQQALKIDRDSTEAQLFLISCLLRLGDYNTAGTYLGEVGEKIDSGAVHDPNAIRFYRMQLERFQSR